MKAVKQTNPFAITKSVDLTDEQINDLWVDITGDDTLLQLARPSSPVPMFILGGKGSGKTHLIRYCSYPVQKLRYRQSDKSLLTGIQEDSYIGLYLRCSGLHSARFQGKGQSAEQWQELFSYYLELWFAQEVVKVIADIAAETSIPDESLTALTQSIAELFDRPVENMLSFDDLSKALKRFQQELDFEINNAAFTGTLNVIVRATRGKLIYGIPRCATEHLDGFKDVLFVYQIDEFENLTEDQQKHINTLIREKILPTSFKIGARLYGVKTRCTNSADEENLQGSEYEELRLDERFRGMGGKYEELVRNLVVARIRKSGMHHVTFENKNSLDRQFEDREYAWDSPWLTSLFKPDQERPHLKLLMQKLNDGLGEGLAPGVENQDHISSIARALSVPDYPVLEKLNLLLLYQNWFREEPLVEVAHEIEHQCAGFISVRTENSTYGRALSHYSGDVIAQLLRENGQKQVYAGFKNFSVMSEGLPRTLITILKHVTDWAHFAGEEPFCDMPISLDAQKRGVREAARWFVDNMRKTGQEGALLKAAMSRLAQLFRENRFADKPIECSLIAFSADTEAVSTGAARIIQMAQERSLLIDVAGGQRERNSERVTAKLQINRMLSPLWDLPIARRGVIPFGAEDLNAIFDPTRTEAFEALLNNWRAKMTAPSFGKRRGKLVEARLPKRISSNDGVLGLRDIFQDGAVSLRRLEGTARSGCVVVSLQSK